MSAPAPVDDLYRGRLDSVELRDDTGGTSGTMYGHFTVFDTWYEIDSWYEGRFLERVAPGALTKTIRENRDSVVVQYDHGYDMHIGDAPLGVIEDLRADDVGGYYEVALLDTDYVRDRVLPMLQGRTLDGRTLGSVLGASFRFRVTKEEWVNPTKATDQNPDKLPERTIRELRLYEFGPVVFPANPAATAAARSLTDHYIARRIARSGAAERAARDLLAHTEAAAPSTADHTAEPARSHSDSRTLDVADVRALITRYAA